MEERHFSEQELVRREKLNFLRENETKKANTNFSICFFCIRL